MKRNISLLLGTIIGLLAASSLVQTYSSEYSEILNVFTGPLNTKANVQRLPKQKEKAGAYNLYLPDSDVKDDNNPSGKLHIYCFQEL